ncbi:MAG: M15 family metallopeptidase [Bdellovibrionales bacterium]|nr:M15 family metallopeptidase [Bdellovibrionales bacterium]
MKPAQHPYPCYLLKGFEQKVATPAYKSHVTVPFIDLEEVSKLLPQPFLFDVRYARTDNFFKRQVYPTPNVFLQEDTAIDLIRAHRFLNKLGYGIVIFDGYRPWSVTKHFYDECQPFEKNFLADPVKGSTHNRGCAVDIGMYNLKTGKAVEMPSDFDEMNERAYTEYLGGLPEPRLKRDLLQTTMKEHHFTSIKVEWWHFNHRDQLQWPVLDLPFTEILRAPRSS